MITIAQQLGIKDFPFIIWNDSGKQIYFEENNGFWVREEYDSNNNRVYFEDSKGYWVKYEYEASDEVYCEDAKGVIFDKRKKTITMNEIALKFGIPVESIRIIK